MDNPYTDNDEYRKLKTISDQFASTALKVNDASVQRKEHTQKAIVYIEEAENAGGLLLKELRVGSKESILLRNRHDAVLNICRILQKNAEAQGRLLDDIVAEIGSNSTLINDLYLSRVRQLNQNLTQSLEKAVGYLESIVQLSNEMILVDNVIQTSKRYHKKRVEQLKKLAQTALEDADGAIEGSRINTDFGEELIDEMSKIPDYVKNGNQNQLKRIMSLAQEGAENAISVNKKSRSQFAFAEKVTTFTRQLHGESLHIRELVSRKHAIFTKNLEYIAEVAVVVAVEFFEYLSISDLKNYLLENEEHFNSRMTELVYDLTAYIETACADVESVTNLNYDMTNTISLNAKIEERTVDLTTNETGAFEKIKSQVMLMTEKTRFPVDGSSQNIENARRVHRLVRSIVQNAFDEQ